MRLRVPVFKCSVSLWYSTNSTREFGTSSAFCVQQQNLCARHTTGTKCEEKERERTVFDPLWPKE